MFKSLLTLLLLFIAPTAAAVDLVRDDDRYECGDYWSEREPNYYDWEWCLFAVSGTYENDELLSPEDHQALFERVWADYMGDAEPPRLRRGETAIEEVCEPLGLGEHDGCFHYTYEPCGSWLMCLVPETIAVQDTGERILLHETAHAIYYASYWHPYWGSSAWGSDKATSGHTLGYRCLLVEIYALYTDDVADDAYEMLREVCVGAGW